MLFLGILSVAKEDVDIGMVFMLQFNVKIVFIFCALLSVRKLQLVFELNHSQCRENHDDDGHACKNFNVRPGRSAPFARSIEVSYGFVIMIILRNCEAPLITSLKSLISSLKSKQQYLCFLSLKHHNTMTLFPKSSD